MASKTKKKVANEKNLVSISQKLSEKTTSSALINLTNVKTVISKSLDEIATEMAEHLKSLKELRDAIDFEKANLKELYDLSIELDKVEQIRAANEVTIITLEETLKEKKFQSTRDFDDFKVELDRQREQLSHSFKRQTDREAEEWEDSKKSRQAKFDDELNKRTNALEERERFINSQQKDYLFLKDELESLKVSQGKEIEKEKAIVANSITKDLTNKFALEKLALENKINLLNREIELANNTNTELHNQNGLLSKNYQDATLKVQQIAEKAVEASSKQQVVINSSSEGLNTGKRS